ncbi:photoreceptor cilium actin regulator [Pangasianodon hypophthalmus]|uniref:photoreceptor cilium actin regulator n=1 Tax=Pangasianodon hypophthalmus TaxID=310915 RepID=UPI00230724D7|nr:photoreceptor cilium actin regulator [Pangasianodon hypophthalmus]
MGCSPSRGNKFNGAQRPFSKGKTLLPGTKGTSEDGQSDDGGSVSSGGGETDGEFCEKRTIGEERLNHDTISVPLNKKHPVGEPGAATVTSERLDTQEITINVSPQRKEKQIEKEDEKTYEKRGARKSKNQKNAKSSKKKDKGRKSGTEKKVDFPEQLVKAHQAAYGYLNPSIDKYELLLGLLDHAAQTHISLQPMVAFMALRYEEFNRGLEEIVEEGEKLLQDHEGHLAWPCNRKNLTSSGKPSTTEPPPDLLQQLLQYTVQRMRVVGQSVKGIGDTALEDAVDYFSSMSEVLEEKLNAKRAIEARLMQLLTRIEGASLRRPGPEDSTLFSEDSGIGVESESLAGSDRQSHRKESCESTESSHTVIYSPENSTPIHQGSSKCQLNQKISYSSSVTSIDSTCTFTGKVFRDTESLLDSASLDDGEEEEEDNIEGNEEEHYEGKMRMRSSSSPPDPGHQTQCMTTKRIENPQNVEMTLKMKDAISERINFVSSQHSGEKIKTRISKTNDQQWMEEGEKSPKRPQTATHQATKKKIVTKQRRSRSAESLRSKADDPTLLELERTQKELSKRLEKMGKVKTEQNFKKEISKQRKQTQSGPINLTSSNSQRKALSEKIITGNQEEEKEKKKVYKTSKGPMKATSHLSPPSSPKQLLAKCPRGNSVKKLIDTFSQGMDESKQFHESSKGLGPLKGVRKYGIPVIPGLGSEDPFSCIKNDIMNNQRESTTLENQDDIDLDNLPPPPLEVLMDNSFENVEMSKTDEKLNRREQSTLSKTTSMSQRLRTSMQSVTVLPSKGSVRKSSHSISPAQNIALHPSGVAKNSQVASTANADLRNEEAASLYKQARKIIHLRYSSNSPTEKPAADNDNIQQLTQRSIERNQRDKKIPETVPSSETAGNQSPDNPDVSRTRMLPSTPVVHRRLPSPPVFKKQPISSSSASPLIFRKLPTPPPASQRTLPTTPTTQDAMPSCISGVTYSFKAPSPPASPKVQRRSRDNNNEDSASRVFSNARSVFCPASPSLFEAQPFVIPKPPQAWTSSGSSILPRPWGERGKLPMSVRGPQPFIRRSQSDRRPSLSLPPRAPVVSIAQSCGSEPAISTQGLEDGPIRDTWNKQLELREANRSSSHPDLCIVGQALQCE